MARHEKICPTCGRTFYTQRNAQRYCGIACANKKRSGYKEAKRRAAADEIRQRSASLEEDALAATDAGMSYGKWMLEKTFSAASGRKGGGKGGV